MSGNPSETGQLDRRGGILILGVKGMQAHFARIGKPSQPDSFCLAFTPMPELPLAKSMTLSTICPQTAF
jgi:hypothetical protein